MLKKHFFLKVNDPVVIKKELQKQRAALRRKFDLMSKLSISLLSL
jgi:hypothetical protein